MDIYTSDNPNINPGHYKANNGLEVIDIIRTAVEGFNGIDAVDYGNIIKYLLRWHKKNGLEDLEKAFWYSQHLYLNHSEPHTWFGTGHSSSSYDILSRLVSETFSEGIQNSEIKELNKKAISVALTITRSKDLPYFMELLTTIKDKIEEALL